METDKEVKNVNNHTDLLLQFEQILLEFRPEFRFESFIFLFCVFRRHDYYLDTEFLKESFMKNII